jgi:hypothetical protein
MEVKERLRAKIVDEEFKFTENKKYLTGKKGQDAVAKASLKELAIWEIFG